MAQALSVVEMILAVILTVLVLLQTKGSDLGGFLGGSSDLGTSRTRRGVEATMHRLTIATAVVFFIMTLVTFFVLGG